MTNQPPAGAPAPLTFERRVLVYIPVYNCADKIVSVLDEIPPEVWAVADFMVVDNCSTDDTARLVLEADRSGKYPRRVHLIQPPRNLGYAGSQKLAYKIAVRSPSVEKVIMLHGDGQYSPELLKLFVPLLDSTYGVVYGFRDRRAFPSHEETPRGSYMTIKVMSAVESYLTGVRRKEWHTGFVMYGREFLSRVDLDNLTSTPHIDGNLLFVSGLLDESVLAVPIWKRYRGYKSFAGLRRPKYLFDVFSLIVRFRLNNRRFVRTAETPERPIEYTVLTGSLLADVSHSC